jgi:hypothetical protein
MPSRRGIRAAAVLLALTASGACALPTPSARGSKDYGQKAAHTADEVRGAVKTTALALRAQSKGNLPTTTLDVIVTESEADAGGAASTFRAIDPPSSSSDDKDLRDRTIDLVDGAVDDLEQVRLDVRAGHFATAAGRAHDLDALADELDRFAEEVGQS